jgi:hypothetical protein
VPLAGEVGLRRTCAKQVRDPREPAPSLRTLVTLREEVDALDVEWQLQLGRRAQLRRGRRVAQHDRALQQARAAVLSADSPHHARLCGAVEAAAHRLRAQLYAGRRSRVRSWTQGAAARRRAFSLQGRSYGIRRRQWCARGAGSGCTVVSPSAVLTDRHELDGCAHAYLRPHTRHVTM